MPKRRRCDQHPLRFEQAAGSARSIQQKHGIKLMKITTRGNGQDFLQQCERGGAARLLAANESEHGQLEEIETLAQMALELCWEIEKFPVSVHQTNAAIQAARLRAAILEKGIAPVR
jgi:hypothetical protein